MENQELEKIKKGLLVFFALFLISSEMYAGVSPAIMGAAASSAAAAQRRQAEERKQQHETQYHNGPLTYYVEDFEIWSWKKPYIISFYKRKHFYYQKDPDRCIQYSEDVFIEKRFATEQETYEHDLHIKYMLIIITFLVAVLIGIITGSCIYDRVKKKKGKGNITYTED